MTADEKVTWEKIKAKIALLIDENKRLVVENAQLKRDLEYWRNRGMGNG